MADASICGLGQAAPNPIACVVKYFPHELDVRRIDAMNAPHERARRSRRSTFRLNGADVAALPGETIIEVADRLGVDDPAPLLQAGHAPRRQLPRVHGRDQGRARAGAVVLPHAGGGHGSDERQRARACTRRR